MSAKAASTFNAIANGSLSPLSPLFSSKTLCPFLSIPSKPLQTLHLCSSFSASTVLSLKSKISSSSGPLVPLVARTSGFARHEEQNEIDEVGFEWEEEEQVEETVARFSDWEGEGEELDGEEQSGMESAIEEEEEGGEGGFVEEEDGYPVPPEEAKIFVGNLPYEVESADLAELFNKAGIVETAEVIYKRETDQSRGFGFVTMSTAEEAEKAVEMFHRYDVNGRLLTVNKAAPRGSRVERSPREYEPTFRIYVGNLPWGVDDARLEQVFNEHGKVAEARVVYDKETGRSRGFGFVTMSSQVDLDGAVAALDGHSLDGRAIRVSAAEERPRRGFF